MTTRVSVEGSVLIAVGGSRVEQLFKRWSWSIALTGVLYWRGLLLWVTCVEKVGR